jgi:hypothetical protein
VTVNVCVPPAGSVAVLGEIWTATTIVSVPELPFESVTVTMSEPGRWPAVYVVPRPVVVESTGVPEPAVVIAHVYVTPAAGPFNRVSVDIAPGETLAGEAEMTMPTVTLHVAVLPHGSVSVTVSEPGVTPAVYKVVNPLVVESDGEPDPLAVSAHVYAVPGKGEPLIDSVSDPPGVTDAVDDDSDSDTVILASAVLPAASAHWRVSLVPFEWPAV